MQNYAPIIFTQFKYRRNNRCKEINFQIYLIRVVLLVKAQSDVMPCHVPSQNEEIKKHAETNKSLGLAKRKLMKTC